MNQSSPVPDAAYVPPAKVKYDHEQRAREKVDVPPVTMPEKGRVECLQCHLWLPFDQFDDLTDPQCASCRSTAAERELKEIKTRACKDFTRKLATEVHKEGRQPLEHVEQFLAELMYDFGGMRVFVMEWSEQLKRSFREKPGSKVNLDHCARIAKLVMETNRLQHQEDVLDLSDEQLRVKKELALMQILSDAAGDPHRRQLLVELIRSNGIQLSEIPGLPEIPVHAT